MKFAGSVTVKAPPDQLWAFLINPDQINQCVPSLKWWLPTNTPNHYLAELTFKWGGKLIVFESNIIWQNLSAPQKGEMVINGQSKYSDFTATSQMTLTPMLLDTTQINWQAEAQLTGRIAEIPETFVKTAALFGVNRFFKNVKLAFDTHPYEY